MNVSEAIQSRRSIRRFKPDPLPTDVIRQILEAARLAPSGKNRQPWRFVVVQGEEREAMYACLQAGLQVKRAEGEDTRWAEHTFHIMRAAPVTVFVFNPDDTSPWQEQTPKQRISGIIDTQSVGGAIQSMLLQAQELGVGSLWIGYTFYAYEQLCSWLNKDSLLVAAVSLGYADEAPYARPRIALDELVEWRG